MISRYLERFNSGGTLPDFGACSNNSTLAKHFELIFEQHLVYQGRCTRQFHSGSAVQTRRKLFEPFTHFSFGLGLAVNAAFS